MTQEARSHDANARLTALIPRLMSFARLIQGLANRFKGAARSLAVSGVISGLILAWLASHGWQLSSTVSLILGVILLLPGLVLGWCWYVLEEASNLPQRLISWVNRVGGYAGEVRQRMGGEAGAAPSTARVSDLKQLGGLAFDIASMGLDSRDLISILGGTLSFTNPVFLIVLLVATGLIALLDTVAIISALVAIF